MTRRIARLLITAILAAFIVHALSIRAVDLGRLPFPFAERETVPEQIRWMQAHTGAGIALKNGRHIFVSEDCSDEVSGCPTLTKDAVKYGRLNGISGEIALVVMTYHSGGTATWQYVYVVGISNEKPKVLAWLETGSRADNGLRNISITGGDLLIDTNDPKKRSGDCCSAGTISTRFRWRQGSFQQVGTPTFSESKQ